LMSSGAVIITVLMSGSGTMLEATLSSGS